MQQEFSEQQLMQMAQQEEAVLNSKRNFLRKIVSIYQDSERTIASLEEMGKNPEKMYMNLGSGVLIEVEAKNKTNCKRAFAENGYLEEKITQTLKWLEKKKDTSKQQVERIEQDIASSDAKLSDIVSVLRQIETEKRKQFNISKK
ncbi:MAG: hypothetical protein HON47_00940 [Candidatus Diapherotrites archaeon]|jgi:prefoldin subunit 5|uniref:Prefoldin subunit alpha n=1 Tax=Candidatus Iainarchaeum sp. TaxID=3101447 RepID=A0A8T5GDT4_9ARCH|nr:hypothetical protein [Candidatus Diapherotrites archaeon]MBT7241398.1 hypothetical protein [Candidatus Diapherotrites archaeon]